MRPCDWAEYAHMVAEITRLDTMTILERYPLACGHQARALWWQSKHYHTMRPGQALQHPDAIV